MTTINPILLNQNDQYTLKIDQGDHYYAGIVNKLQFPEDLTDHIQITQNAIKGYKSESETIIGEFIKGDTQTSYYSISYNIKFGLFNKKFSIKIPMTLHQKEQMDYINERFAELDSRIKYLNAANEKLQEELVNISKKLDEELPYDSEEEAPPKKNSTPPTVTEQTASKRRPRVPNV